MQGISPPPYTVWGGMVDSGACHMIEPTFLAFSLPEDITKSTRQEIPPPARAPEKSLSERIVP